MTFTEQAITNRRRWFLGNEAAVNFCNALFLAVELWDDLIDKDKEITPERVNEAMLGLFWALPANPWFAEHRQYYLPLIMTAINGFHDANELAKSDKTHLRNLAFHLRNFGFEITIATAFLAGGYLHMRSVSREIREFYAFETFEEWEQKHA